MSNVANAANAANAAKNGFNPLKALTDFFGPSPNAAANVAANTANVDNAAIANKKNNLSAVLGEEAPAAMFGGKKRRNAVRNTRRRTRAARKSRRNRRH